MESGLNGMNAARGMAELASDSRDRLMLTEFSLFLNRSLAGKQCMQDDCWMDAFNHISNALVHWANIAMLQAGVAPEERIWEQTREINLGIYKLYEELSVSGETLEQRIKLAILACEFSVMSKMEQCCALLFRIMESREEPWSIQEISEHQALAGVAVDLEPVLQKLELKSLIHEVAVACDDQFDALERKYRISG